MTFRIKSIWKQIPVTEEGHFWTSKYLVPIRPIVFLTEKPDLFITGWILLMDRIFVKLHYLLQSPRCNSRWRHKKHYGVDICYGWGNSVGPVTTSKQINIQCILFKWLNSFVVICQHRPNFPQTELLVKNHYHPPLMVQSTAIVITLMVFLYTLLSSVCGTVARTLHFMLTRHIS